MRRGARTDGGNVGAGGASAPPLPPWAMAAEDVGPIVIRAIRANRFYVLSHQPSSRARRSRSVARSHNFSTLSTLRSIRTATSRKGRPSRLRRTSTSR